jgi:tetratricopeptide (TPR) repeat protein
MDDLRGKLEEYKEKKKIKIERKGKWENWKKTQALFYKKTSTNYKKWDFFDSESDSDKEDNSDPILPKNDPTFKAMEADMMDRKKRRLVEQKEANEFKEKGNFALKKGCYKTAIKYYSDAIDVRKDILPLYTNRALARLKVEDY